ncbi:hypothetical protein Hypma_010795 [Hypsizygus marmoreus]|uniref:F-box domain-containing protein n=1 Tax=Hypsizygus marmoreus TaxID=39966 RepID=A0A369JQV0_HYPMA|nr:hypothetical protein Hypma_010795 [Hypsizygus marmoreus]
MHRCLYISEILSLVCDNVLEENGYTPGLRTLAGVARTCRAFSDPALDLLWRSRSSIAPLIRVMPDDLWMECESLQQGRRVKVIKYRRALEDSDWSRFEYYGSKIRDLTQFSYFALNYFEEVVHEDVFMAITGYRPVRTILPKLRQVALELDYPHLAPAIPFYQCILGPSIRSLTMSGTEEEKLPASLLLSIPRLCPNISTLHISSAVDLDPENHSALYRSLCRLRNLRYVDVVSSPGPTEEAVLHLSQLISLKSFKSIVISSSQASSFTTQGGCFKNLQDFSFEVNNWDIATQVMKGMHSSFVTLSICVNGKEGPNTLAAFRKFMSSFHGHPALSSILSLKIAGHVTIPKPRTMNTRSFSESMKMLSSFTSLQDLTVNIPSLSHLDDSWLSAAAANWPHLRSLILRGKENPKMTLEGLIPVLKHCPDLNDLDVTAFWKPFQLRLLEGICNTEIRYINVWKSKIESPIAVFRCLTTMFPKLRMVCYDEDEADWGELNEMFEQCAAYVD